MSEATLNALNGRLAKGETVDPLESGGYTLYLDQPVALCPAAAPYMAAFQQLMGQRHIDGMGAVGEIRREAVTDWLDENEITDAFERERYRNYLMLCDRAYLSIASAQREREHKKIEETAKKVKH